MSKRSADGLLLCDWCYRAVDGYGANTMPSSKEEGLLEALMLIKCDYCCNEDRGKDCSVEAKEKMLDNFRGEI